MRNDRQQCQHGSAGLCPVCLAEFRHLEERLEEFGVDPTGKEQHEPGAKLDSGKILADDILAGFANALIAVCEVGTKGAAKYSLNGWMSVEDGERRYANAQMRHKLKEWTGEKVDPEMQVKHAAQDAWNALARLELMLRSEKGENVK